MIGSSLKPRMTATGHEVVALVRKNSAGGSEASWQPDEGDINLKPAGRIDGVVHLAGETIAQRWTPEVKRRIRGSRVEGTRLLCEALLKQTPLPKVLLCASATGYYGNRGEELLDEASAPGSGFLADVCREWEAATDCAKRSGVRVVNLRFGVVLSERGGALKKMLPAFRLGLGGKIGNGEQHWSWIGMDDLVSAVEFALANEGLEGPVNIVAPCPLRNIEFTKALGAVLRRPTFFTVPALAVNAAMGEMGREALLSSFRVKPSKLDQHGFRFHFPELRGALKHLLSRKNP